LVSNSGQRENDVGRWDKTNMRPVSLRDDPQIIAAVWTHLPGEMRKRMMDDIVAYLATLEPGE